MITDDSFLGRWAQITNGGKCGICGDNAAWKNQPHM